MKFGVPIPCFFGGMDFIEAICKVKKLGFDVVETYEWSSLDRQKVKAVLDDNGMELVSILVPCSDLTNPSGRKTWLEALEKTCAAAREMGVKRVITQVGNDTNEERAFQHESIVEGLRAASPILEDSGVTVMIEPLNTYYDHPGYYLWSSKEAFDIIREVNHPLVKVVYDIYHQQIMEGNIIKNVTENLDCIAHLHSAGHPGRHELQFGENDYKVIFNAISDAGYKDTCSLEYTPLLNPEESLREFKKIYMEQ